MGLDVLIAWLVVVGCTGWSCWRLGYGVGQRDEARRVAQELRAMHREHLRQRARLDSEEDS